MPPNDHSPELDSRIAATVERSIGQLREELLSRVRETEDRLRRLSRRLGEEEEAVPIPAAAADSSAELLEALRAVDRAASQQEVLAALLEAAGRFASRSALFLIRAAGARGWGSYGFDETAGELEELVLPFDEIAALASLSEGRGCVDLDAAGCAEICARLGSGPGAEGVLVPFVLRDRLVAALYADRGTDDAPLGRQPLQLLTHVAALAVESLPVRGRAFTPTLYEAGAAPAEAGVAVWDEEVTAAPAAEAAAADAEQVGFYTEEVATAAEPVVEPEAVPEEPMAVEAEELPAPELAEAAEPIEAAEAIEPAEPIEPAEAIEAAEPAFEEPAAAPPLQETGFEMPSLAEDVTAAPPATGPEMELADEFGEPLEAPAEPPPPPPMEPAAAEPETEALETAELPPTAPPAAAAPPEPVPEAPEPPAAPTAPEAPPASTQVLPPSDLEGPGWAFTSGRTGAQSGDEGQHEEARRLAKLLVTEIKLYNEEQVAEGRRSNDIYARLKEDIDRSRQIFDERVDPAVRQDTDYFQDEMIRILAGGNSEALGI